MSITLTSTCANAEADATARLLDSGLIKIYSGTVPANASASIGAAVLLATLTFSSTSAPGASGGVMTASAITSDSSADATGAASFFRATKSDGTVLMQGTVTATGGGGDMTLPTTAVVATEVVSCSSFTYTRS